MYCDRCGGKTKVKDSRTMDSNITYRRHYCEACNYTFYTSEKKIEDISEMQGYWVNHNHEVAAKKGKEIKPAARTKDPLSALYRSKYNTKKVPPAKKNMILANNHNIK